MVMMSTYQIYVPGSNGSLVIAIKPRIKETSCSCHAFVLYFTRRKYFKKCAHFSKIYYYTAFQYRKLRAVRFTSTSQVHASVMLSLLVPEN
jgi:hypothetical protein